jgi:hypothetical protein
MVNSLKIKCLWCSELFIPSKRSSNQKFCCNEHLTLSSRKSQRERKDSFQIAMGV